MDVEAPRGLLRLFEEIEDPRMERTKLHRLVDTGMAGSPRIPIVRARGPRAAPSQWV
jgi:hypothetical protein